MLAQVSDSRRARRGPADRRRIAAPAWRRRPSSRSTPRSRTTSWRPFKAAIEKAVPEVEVEWVRDSTGVITARFLAEKDNPKADIVLGLAAS